MNELKEGTRVVVRTLSGEPVELVVAGLTDEGEPLFCSPEEYAAARQEQREPLVVGWPHEDILSVVEGVTARQVA